MTRQPSPESELLQTLRRIALRYPETQEGSACNKSAFKARNKSFLFLGMEDRSTHIMVKLRASLAEAARLDQCKVGANGWVTAVFDREHAPPPGLLEKWIDESYRLLAPRQLVALLDAGAIGTAKKVSKKRSSTR
jgi:hypothetical protein